MCVSRTRRRSPRATNGRERGLRSSALPTPHSPHFCSMCPIRPYMLLFFLIFLFLYRPCRTASGFMYPFVDQCSKQQQQQQQVDLRGRRGGGEGRGRPPGRPSIPSTHPPTQPTHQPVRPCDLLGTYISLGGFPIRVTYPPPPLTPIQMAECRQGCCLCIWCIAICNTTTYLPTTSLNSPTY